MSNDKTTLADVQPGGAVRLGSGWTGWATQYPGKMPKLYGAREIAEVNHHPDEGQRLFFLSENPVHVGNLVDAARAALPFVAFAYSKGMDDAEEAGRAIEAALSAQPSPGGQDAMVQEALEYFERAGDAGDREYVAAIRAALAARQPVGQEPIGFQFRSRQWSDEEFAGPWLNPNVPNRAHYDSRPANYETRSIYAASPAQAVDLGEFRASVLHAYEETHDGYHSEKLGSLLALIDSQAVGNG